MVTYDTKTKAARELKEEVSALKKKLKEMDADDRELRLRLSAYKASVEKLNAMYNSVGVMKIRVNQGRTKSDRLESDYEKQKDVYRNLIYEV